MLLVQIQLPVLFSKQYTPILLKIIIMNAFEKMLNSSASQIRGQRATLVAKTAKKAQEKLVSDLDDKLDDLENQILQVSDLAPTSELSLMVVQKDFKAIDWVTKLHKLKVEKANIEIELEIAKETFEEFFAEITPSPKKPSRNKNTPEEDK